MITIGRLQEELSRRSGWYLVGGRVLEGLPRGSEEVSGELYDELKGAVLARIDVEEVAPYSRPLLLRNDLGRDFWIGDGSGEALVRVGEGGHVHPDVELHLDAPFVQHEPEEQDDDEDLRRTSYLRTVRTGDQVYVWGRPELRYSQNEGYRDSALAVEFSPKNVIHIYDEDAWRKRLRWRALPWYRKLSVLVRNR